jgi:flagellar biosynthesis protein FlhB
MADDAARTIPATPRRREAARRAGQGAPADLPAWAASAAAAILLAPAWARLTIPAAAESVRETITAALAPGGTEGASPWPLPAAVVLPTLGLVAAAAAAGLAVRMVCDGWSWQPGRAAPDLGRINPAAGLARIVSPSTLGSLGVAAVALGAVTAVAAVAARPLVAIQTHPVAVDAIAQVAIEGWRAAAWLVAGGAAAAVGQWLLARRRFERRIRMTPQELAEELKDLQADPRVKLLQQQRRQPVAGTS